MMKINSLNCVDLNAWTPKQKSIAGVVSVYNRSFLMHQIQVSTKKGFVDKINVDAWLLKWKQLALVGTETPVYSG